MQSRVFELVEEANTNYKITITPTRFAVKIAKGATPQQKDRFINFAENINGSMKEVTSSWRGACKNVKPDHPVRIIMNTRAGGQQCGEQFAENQFQ